MPSRTRSRGGFTPKQAVITYTRHGPTSPSWYSGYTTWGANLGGLSYSGTYQTTTDVIGSGFRAGLPPEKWINNPFSSTATLQQRHEASPTVINCAPNANGQYLSCSIVGDVMSALLGTLNLPASADGQRNSAIGKASIECLNRIETPSSQSLVTALEFGKTLALVTNPGRTLLSVMEACRRGDRAWLQKRFPWIKAKHRVIPTNVVIWGGDGRPLLNKRGKPISKWTWSRSSSTSGVDIMSQSSRLWLEYRYGWRPLVFDIVDTLKAWHAQELRDSLRKRDLRKVTGKGAFETLSSTTSVVTEGVYRRWTYRTDIVQRSEAHCFAYYEVDKSWGSNLQRLNDFGVFDVPRAAWEVVPFSFVADWFVPIGDWLGALTPKVGVNIIASGTTDHTTRESVRTVTKYEWLGSTAATGDNFGAAAPLMKVGSTDKVSETKRTRTTNLTAPSFPPVDVKINLSRVADAFALFQGFKGASNLRV